MIKNVEINLKILKDISLISIVSVFAYAATYLYYLGASFYFGYPYDLIDISINSILKAGADFILLFLPSFAILGYDFGAKGRIRPTWVVFAVAYSMIGFYNAIIGFKIGLAELLEYKAIQLILIVIVAILTALSLYLINSIKLRDRVVARFHILLVFVFSMVCFCTSGFMVASKSSDVYQVYKEDGKPDGGFIFLGSTGGGSILGKCDGGDSFFKKLPAGESLILMRITSRKEIRKSRECFDGSYQRVFTGSPTQQ
ncbi:hypothetical protein [Serratia ureilytica]|uniref:hypothetical protein n=1 Tax=Serratia ureilytica TaxID=300181 RepID=UPI001D19583B|nr:hypothetical protein [Serratia ureilytica]MCC4108104.1 hypothetical protein [Serratia ureilytica]